MKQAIKKTSSVKEVSSKTPVAPKVDKATKEALHLQKTNQFNRFLEASCDCV